MATGKKGKGGGVMLADIIKDFYNKPVMLHEKKKFSHEDALLMLLTGTKTAEPHLTFKLCHKIADKKTTKLSDLNADERGHLLALARKTETLSVYVQGYLIEILSI